MSQFISFVSFLKNWKKPDSVSLPNRTLMLGTRRLYEYDSSVKTLLKGLGVLAVEVVR